MWRLRPIMQNALFILQKSKMGLLKVGKGIQCGAIHRGVEKQARGSRKHMKSINAPDVQWSCYCLHELMWGGFMIISWVKLRLDF